MASPSLSSRTSNRNCVSSLSLSLSCTMVTVNIQLQWTKKFNDFLIASCYDFFNNLLHGRYEDAFTRFVNEINGLAAYQWWEGSVYSILCILAYPLSWSWLQRRRKKKLQRLREFVRSEYDHACLRSCRSRALYEGLKVYLFTKNLF